MTAYAKAVREFISSLEAMLVNAQYLALVMVLLAVCCNMIAFFGAIPLYYPLLWDLMLIVVACWTIFGIIGKNYIWRVWRPVFVYVNDINTLDDAKAWVHNHIDKNDFKIRAIGVFEFKHKSDALAFKLIW